MKTSLTLKSLIMFAGVVGITLFMFSCAKGSDNNNNQNQHNTYQNCTNCNGLGNGQTFFQSQSTDIMNQFSLSLSFTGQVMYANGTGSSPIVGYSGPVAAFGNLVINQNITTYHGCVIPSGNYTVSTVQAGTWNQGIVSNLVLQVGGSFGIAVQIPVAQVSARGATGQTWSETAPIGRLFGNVTIQTLNGMNCQVSSLMQ